MTTPEESDPRLEELAFLRALGEVMASDLRADKALARAVDLCFVRFELGALCAFRVSGGTFRLVAGHGLTLRARARLEQIAERDLQGMLGGPPVLLRQEVSATDECTVLSEDMGAPVVRSALFAPLVHARRRLGALLVIGHEGDRLGAPARATWEPIVNTISVALRAADDFERVVALEAEKRQLVDNLPLIVARFDAITGALLFVNGAVQRVLGVRPSDALNANGLERALADAVERDASRAARERASTGIHSAWEDRRYVHADGRVLTLRECVYPVFDAARSIHAVEIIAYDITTELEARRELMQADRLATLGALAAGVAHEINNPVAFISLAAGQLGKLVSQIERGERGAADRVREVAEDVRESAGRIADIVAELKLFTRISDGSVACPVDLNRILETALALTSRELRRNARLEVQLGELPVAPGAFVNLGHAFVNLLMNAAQAIDSKVARPSPAAPDGGPGERNVIRVETLLRDGAIVVRVRDTGIGIDARVLPRIFEPFFKTDAAGSGAGLGLAIAHDLVRKVGGDIRVESRRGYGTTVEVVLPFEREDEATDVPASTRKDEPKERPHHRRRASARSRAGPPAERPLRGGHGVHGARRARAAERAGLRGDRVRPSHAGSVGAADLRGGPRAVERAVGAVHLHDGRELRGAGRRAPRGCERCGGAGAGEAVRWGDVRGGGGARGGAVESHFTSAADNDPKQPYGVLGTSSTSLPQQWSGTRLFPRTRVDPWNTRAGY
jgi:PAS domain S-box-containing protein